VGNGLLLMSITIHYIKYITDCIIDYIIDCAAANDNHTTLRLAYTGGDWAAANEIHHALHNINNRMHNRLHHRLGYYE
jgi:hypothetical protein